MNLKSRQTYAAFLRGINVGGRNRIGMAEVVRVFAGLGYEDIATYIQSGNIMFDAPAQPAKEIENAVEEVLSAVMGLHIACLVRTAEELLEIAGKNPFVDKDIEKQCVVLLKDFPEKERATGIVSPNEQGEMCIITGKEVYLFCPDGFGSARFSNNFFESRLGLKATTRNIKTVGNMSELASRRGTVHTGVSRLLSNHR